MSGIVDNTQILTSMDIGVRSATAGNMEDLLPFITIVSPMETPLLSSLRKTVAKATTHEWLIDSLDSFGDPENGVSDVSVTPEAYDAEFTTPSNRKRLSNLTHILRETVDVSDTQRAVATAGIEDEYRYQLRKKLLVLARKAEFALLHSQLNAQTVVGNSSGSPATGRMMEGILNYLEPDPAGVTSNYLDSTEEGTITEAGSGSARLTETIYNDHCQAAWEKGVIFKTCYMNSAQKREMSGFTANVTRNINAAEQAQIANINVFEGDFGRQALILHRHMPKRVVLTLDEDYWYVALLRAIQATELARTGNSTRAMVEMEYTLEARAPSTGGKITNCSNIYGSNA